jgi:prepilin-type N-terminal cleavage/methylation domain-containing protein
MTNQERPARERGFTLIEMLVVLAILFTAVMIGLPYLSSQLERGKLIGTASQASGLMRLARMEAIKRSQCAMVAIDAAQGKVSAFSDRDGDCRPGAGDVLLAEVALTKGVNLTAPDGATGNASVKGFTAWGGGASLAVFQSDGSVADTGAFRFQGLELGGRKANYLEVNVAPAATARIELRKWRGPDSGSGVNDDANWLANGDGGSWTWN